MASFENMSQGNELHKGLESSKLNSGDSKTSIPKEIGSDAKELPKFKLNFNKLNSSNEENKSKEKNIPNNNSNRNKSLAKKIKNKHWFFMPISP